MIDPEVALQILLHAPSAAALSRARSNVANVRKTNPDVIIRIVINGDAVQAAFDSPEPSVDSLTLVCPNTLKKLNLQAPLPFTVLQEGAVISLAKMQGDGWCYVRA